MKNVLVTGGTGFIGSNLALALLQRGCNVRILRRHDSDLRAIAGIDVEQCTGDVRDPDSLQAAMKGCDTVFHTAGMVTFERSRRQEQYEVNVLGTRNVAEACLASGVEKLVHTSSVAAVGYTEDRSLATEETVYNWGGTGGYRYSKHLAEGEILNAVKSGLHAVMVNPSVVVGERDIHFHGGQIVRDIRKGIIPFYVNGGMNVVYVGDVVNGHIAAATRGRTGERYILSGENLTHREIFRRTARLVGGRAPFAPLPIPLLRAGAKIIETASKILRIEPLVTTDLVAGAGKYNWFSCAKAERELGYTIAPFDRAILAAYEWYRSMGLVK